jgi:hypothetical protein
MLQTVPVKKRDGGQNAKASGTRSMFLKAFEDTCGNVSASCEYAGISRQTFYRWKNSHSRVNVQFQKRLELLKPCSRLVDLAEANLMQRVAAGDTQAILYVLKTKGRDRGWAERHNSNSTNEERDERIVEPNSIVQTVQTLRQAIKSRAEQKGIEYFEELRNYLDHFGMRLPAECKKLLVRDLHVTTSGVVSAG